MNRQSVKAFHSLQIKVESLEKQLYVPDTIARRGKGVVALLEGAVR